MVTVNNGIIKVDGEVVGTLHEYVENVRKNNEEV